MEYIQIFNRSTGQWSERYSQTSGFSESWVIDKTTDTGKDWRIEIKGETPPNIQPNDWVRILHVAAKEETMTYDSNGIPTNSTQYLIKDVNCDYFWQSKKWIVGFTLKEPIERFNGVHGETLSFTNQTQKAFTELVGETPVTTTYYKAPYNHYTALRRWLMVTPANCDSYTAEAQAIKSGKILGGETLRVYTDAALGDYYGSNFSISIYEAGSSDYVLCDVFINGSLYQQKALAEPGEPTPPYVEFVLPVSVGTASSDFPETIKYVEWYPSYQTNISWYNRIKVLDAEWLKTLPFADATYNELNLYNVLMDNFDASTGRTPVAYFDIDPVTDLPRNLDRDEYLLKFERQDGFDKPIIQFNDLKAGNIGYSITQESGNYATGLVCNAENISAASVVNYPAQGLYAVPEVDTDNRTLTSYTAEGENWILKVPFPIKSVKLLKKVLIEGEISEPIVNIYSGNFTTIIADRSEYIREKQEYLAAEPDSEGARYYWYKQGENVIHLREVYYDTNYKTVVYYIEYEPLISCRLSVGDTEYQQQINQTASQIDAEKFSKYANEYLNGMAKADITIGKHYKRFSDFENLIGSRVQDGSKTYMITQVAYKNIGLAGYDVFMQLNENHFRKNNAYQAPQTIRTNTAISTENIKNRQTAIKQVIKIGTTPQTADGYQFLTDSRIALSALKPNAIDSKYYPQVALLKGYSKLYTNSNFSETADFNVTKLATVAKFQFGKQVNLVTTFFDNADAGKYKEMNITGGDENVLGDVGDAKYQAPTLYTDPYGENQIINIIFSSISQDALSEISLSFEDLSYSSQEVAEYNSYIKLLKNIASIPNVDSATITELESNASVEVENQIYLKDMLEKFNNNVIIEYKGTDVIVCNDLIKLSRLLNQTDSHEVVKVRFFNTAKAENDDVETGLISTIGIASSTLNASDIRYTLDSGVVDTQGLSMILLTPNHEKLLIFNNISATMATKLASGYFDICFA